ncbi:Hypp6997 [Branchiostoma lanceolatum]|uniref:Hypp6997 protein n=1 Tax=Branchiostoma lanceolatum TaxID=7740 RepID=A0A8J9YWC0_BRALA|nr:Hypp6997 [Branchiostoma lanceolatum]
MSCGVLDRSLTTISIQAPVVVLATDGSLADILVPNKLEQCRKVWEYDGAIVLGMVGNPIFRLVSTATAGAGNTTFEGVALSVVQTQDTNTQTTTESGCNQKHTIHTHGTHGDTKNITCILLTEDKHTELFFTVPMDPCQIHKTSTTYKTNTDHSSKLTHYSEYIETDYTSSKTADSSTMQVSTTPGPKMPSTTDHVLISVVVSVSVVSLVVLSIAVLIWKVCAARLNTGDERANDDAHIWTIPPGGTLPGLLRSASLPACSSKMASDDVASCRSLPAILQSIESTYCEIPDDIAAAHRPLPGLPHSSWKIPDNTLSGMLRSASLPTVTCTPGGNVDDAASCRSLPAVLLSNEPTYSEIPDDIATALRSLPAQPHTYSEIPDDEESRPMLFYADAAAFSLHVTSSVRHLSGRSIVTYGSTEQTKAQSSNLYRNAPEGHGMGAKRQPRTALVSRPADQRLRTYVNATDEILFRGQNVTEAQITFHTSPDSHWPCKISGEGASITPRRAFLPLVTLPNTYWPWEIPGTRDTPCQSSLPFVELPNTYWPWEIPGEETRNTPRRASLSPATLPNTYGPWEIPGEGTCNTPRHASLSPTTLPNTYWPWEIPGEGTSIPPRRASLPLVTLPNTYWPWEIPGTRDTPCRPSLPLVELPNTYWPWEIPGEETRNTPRRASLSPATLPNTYWPWEIPGTRDTPCRPSLPLVELPNTYWPWEIQGEGTRNTPQRASLSLATLPNTYWPWEVPGEGNRNTPQRASLPLVTLPNTYWPWDIPGEGISIPPRRTSLPLVELPNTYWPWQNPGEGNLNTPQRASLPLVTLPNTY